MLARCLTKKRATFDHRRPYLLTIGGHTLTQHLEAAGYAAAFDYLEKMVNAARPLDADAVPNLHALVMLDLFDKRAGDAT